jgi:hypothetical protein
MVSKRISTNLEMKLKKLYKKERAKFNKEDSTRCGKGT